MSFLAPLIGQNEAREDDHLKSIIFQHPICLKYLLSTLIEAYGDVEKTGH